MNELEIREIKFVKKGESCSRASMFNELYFERRKVNYYPIVYYLYEYCGTSNKVETKTIYYSPINSHWSLLIDSSYP